MSTDNGVLLRHVVQRVYPPKLGDPGLRSSDLQWQTAAGSGDGGATTHAAQPGMVQDGLITSKSGERGTTFTRHGIGGAYLY